MKQISVFIILSLFFPFSSFAGPAEDSWNAYLTGNFEEVQKIAFNVKSNRSISDSIKAETHIILGCSFALTGDTAAASRAFRASLTWNSALKRTAVELPPPAWKLFKPIRESIPFPLESADSIDVERMTVFNEAGGLNLPGDTIIITDTVFVSEFDPNNSNSMVKSFIFPGWGHLSQGNHSGYVFATVQLVTISAGIYFSLKSAGYRDDYLSARNVDVINESYEKYNRNYRLAYGFGIAALTNYIITQIDLQKYNSQLSISLTHENMPSLTLCLQL